MLNHNVNIESLGVMVLITSTLLLGGCSEVGLAPYVAPQKVVSMKIDGYCPATGNHLRETYAINLSTHIENFQWVTDFDRDGLSDAFENDTNNMQLYMINSATAYTAGRTISDLLAVRAGLTGPAAIYTATCLNPTQDTDNDGLTDCEEAFLKTDPNNPDTDGDGIPDGLEIRMGLNPTDPSDAMLDSDDDGVNNLQEVKANTPIFESNTPALSAMAFTYSSIPSISNPQPGCLDVTVGNIPIVSVSNGNLIKVFFLENNNSGKASIQYFAAVAPAYIANNYVIENTFASNQTVQVK